MNFENEVFDATVGQYTRETLARWGADLGQRVASIVPALKASEIRIKVQIEVSSDDGNTEFRRGTSTLVWRSEEELAALEAELEAEDA